LSNNSEAEAKKENIRDPWLEKKKTAVPVLQVLPPPFSE
jgi:hypothetical protein